VEFMKWWLVFIVIVLCICGVGAYFSERDDAHWCAVTCKSSCAPRDVDMCDTSVFGNNCMCGSR